MEHSSINISIGGNEPTLWHVRNTDAPTDYDGFGTFTIADCGDTRVVLIRDEHYNWQTARYGSGMHSCTETNLDMADVSAALWKRLQGKDQQPDRTAELKAAGDKLADLAGRGLVDNELSEALEAWEEVT